MFQPLQTLIIHVKEFIVVPTLCAEHLMATPSALVFQDSLVILTSAADRSV